MWNFYSPFSRELGKVFEKTEYQSRKTFFLSSNWSRALVTFNYIEGKHVKPLETVIERRATSQSQIVVYRQMIQHADGKQQPRLKFNGEPVRQDVSSVLHPVFSSQRIIDSLTFTVARYQFEAAGQIESEH
jgi:hypothetical protein